MKSITYVQDDDSSSSSSSPFFLLLRFPSSSLPTPSSFTGKLMACLDNPIPQQPAWTRQSTMLLLNWDSLRLKFDESSGREAPFSRLPFLPQMNKPLLSLPPCVYRLISLSSSSSNSKREISKTTNNFCSNISETKTTTATSTAQATKPAPHGGQLAITVRHRGCNIGEARHRRGIPTHRRGIPTHRRGIPGRRRGIPTRRPTSDLEHRKRKFIRSRTVRRNLVFVSHQRLSILRKISRS